MSGALRAAVGLTLLAMLAAGGCMCRATGGGSSSEEGELVPVIEASPNKREVFIIAQQLAGAAGVDVTQVGEGIQLG